MNVMIQDAGWCKEMSIRAGVIPRLRLLSLAPRRSQELGLELLEPEKLFDGFWNLKPCWLPPRGFASTLGSHVAVWPEIALDVRWCRTRPASWIGSSRRRSPASRDRGEQTVLPVAQRSPNLTQVQQNPTRRTRAK